MQGLAPSQNQTPITSKLGTTEAYKPKKRRREKQERKEKKKPKQNKKGGAKTKVSPRKRASNVIPPLLPILEEN